MPSKKPTAKTQAKEETYFVSVKSPLELRRQVLECTRKTVHSLQNYHRILQIRDQKIKEMETLKNSLKELMYLNKKLNEKLPEYDYHDILGIEDIKPNDLKMEKIAKKPEIKQVPRAPPPKAPPKEKTELEKLEDSLAAIEGKLSSLNRPV